MSICLRESPVKSGGVCGSVLTVATTMHEMTRTTHASDGHPIDLLPGDTYESGDTLAECRHARPSMVPRGIQRLSTEGIPSSASIEMTDEGVFDATLVGSMTDWIAHNLCQVLETTHAARFRP